MKISIISFTRQGAVLCDRLTGLLSAGYNCEGFAHERFGELPNLSPLTEDLSGWVERHFTDDALIFIGAAGIAVRGIAPFLRGKDVDPAVIVIDELHCFVLPILSGHIGGANRLAKELADMLSATAVITTATDINQVFAVDEWAANHGCVVHNTPMIKVISSGLLEGDTVGLCSDFPIGTQLPKGVRVSEDGERGIFISLRTEVKPFVQTLHILPVCLYVGMGMRKDVAFEVVERLFLETLEEYRLPIKAITVVASIDIKQNEPALLRLCEKYSLPLKCYNAEVLAKTAGDFASSAFVKEITGVDNVCERAAATAAGEKGGSVTRLVEKRCFSGATIAIWQKDWTVGF